MNIFKGMRRLTLVIGIASTAYVIGHAWPNVTYLQLEYAVTERGKVRINSLDCPSLRDGVHSRFYSTAEGNQFEAKICFSNTRNKDWFEISVPWPDMPRRKYEAESPEADAAMREYVDKHFRFSPGELANANSTYLLQLAVQRREKLVEIGVWLILYFGTAAAVGWIVRGFLDIPYGSDGRLYP